MAESLTNKSTVYPKRTERQLEVGGSIHKGHAFTGLENIQATPKGLQDKEVPLYGRMENWNQRKVRFLKKSNALNFI